MAAEQLRLEEDRTKKAPWKKWGPYLSERQWGTVREDYSEGGDAWNYFTHDQARSRAYRWGEDGLAGVSDDRQALCFALALWNGKDPILKERPFGLSNGEGNHGEDVKEYYFYLDSTPTHSYMKYLYKYPQAAYPYDDLVRTNRERGRGQARVRAARHGRVRRRPLLRRVRGVREGVARGPARPDHRPQPRPGTGDAPAPPHRVVPERLVVGRRRRSPHPPSAGPRQDRRDRRALASRPRRALPLRRGRVGAPLHGERHQHPAAVRHPQRVALGEGRLRRLRRPRQEGRGQSRQDGHEGGGPLPAHHRGRRIPHRPSASPRARTRGPPEPPPRAFLERSTRSSRPDSARPTSSTRASSHAPSIRTRPA